MPFGAEQAHALRPRTRRDLRFQRQRRRVARLAQAPGEEVQEGRTRGGAGVDHSGHATRGGCSR